MTAQPPRLAERALAMTIADPEWRESVIGDLSEEFIVMTARLGPSRARWWYRRQALAVATHRTAARFTRRSPMLRRLPEPVESRAGILGMLSHDLRQAWRSVRHHPALSFTVVVVLAVALAANATTFAMADAMVLRPFRYPGVPRAVVVASDDHKRFFWRDSVTAGDFIDWREQTRDVMDRLAGIEWWDPNYTKDGPPQQIFGFLVSPGFFEIVGEPAELGRTLVDADEQSAEPVAVLSHAFWMRQFGSAPDVLGRTIWLDGKAHKVVGVMPARFTVPFGTDVWAPLTFTPEARADRKRGIMMVLGRLAPGVTPEMAENRLQVVLSSQKRLYPDLYSKRAVSVRTFTEGLGDQGSGPFMAVFQTAAFLLLLVACANVANLLLARNTERSRELAVRLALGAGHGRLTWQLVLEALILSALASALAIPLVWAALQAARAALPDSIIRFVPGVSYMSLQPATFAATVVMAVVATLLAAVLPAWRAAHGNVSETLRPGTRVSDGAARQRSRALLAAAQIALTLALLATAGLTMSGLYRVTEGSIGYDTTSILTGRVQLPDASYTDPVKRRQFIDTVLARLSALPSVANAAVTTELPYSGNYSFTHFWTESTLATEKNATNVVECTMTPTALDVGHVPLLVGRRLTAADDERAPLVALVNQATASKFWPNDSAIGKRFRKSADGPLITVVGVVGNVKRDWIALGADTAIYKPVAQGPPQSFAFTIRTVADPAQLTGSLRAAVQAADPEQPVVAVKTMQEVVSDKTTGLRFIANTLGIIAVISALLSSVGLYSLMSFLTMRRTREIGVRVALGATSWDVIKITSSTAARLTAAGVVAGLVLAYLAGRALEQALFGVIESSMPLALGLGALLTVVSLAASYIPSRRAAAIEPTVALRME